MGGNLAFETGNNLNNEYDLDRNWSKDIFFIFYSSIQMNHNEY